MRNKCLAVGSGKGGVGKTTTAVNLAIYYAKEGYATALVDIDPLSNAATLLDVENDYKEKKLEKEASLAAYILPVVKNLDILFPGTKTAVDDSRLLHKLIFETFTEALSSSYDLLIFDLPAGMDEEENLAFLPHMSTLIIVTNPEPTALVAAGAYIKQVIARTPEISLKLWHNRTNSRNEQGLEFQDLIDTYNRNMPEEEHLSAEVKGLIESVAFVPDDPALDLLKGTPSSIMNIHRSLLSVIEQLIDTRTAIITGKAPFKRGIQSILTRYLSRRAEEKEDAALAGLGEFVSGLLSSTFQINYAGSTPFTEAEEKALRQIIRNVRGDRQHRHLRRIRTLLNRKIDQLDDETKLFSKGIHIIQDKDIDREIGLLLRSIEESDAIEQLRPNAAVLLFYFALYKLLQSPTIVTLLNDLIPFREGPRGELRRDRHSQIMEMVNGSEEFRRRYFKLIKTIFPVVGRQIESITKAFGIHSLLLRDPVSKEVRSDSYAKLLSNFIHDTLYSGLSVVVGFEYRSAAIAFGEGAEKLAGLLLPARKKSA